MKTLNHIRTFSSISTQNDATNIANRQILHANRDNWRAIQFEVSSNRENTNNGVIEIHHVTVLFEKTLDKNGENNITEFPEI